MAIPVLDPRTRAGLVPRSDEDDDVHAHAPALDRDLPESSRRRKRLPIPLERAQTPNQLLTAAEYYVDSLPGLGKLATHPTHPLTVFAGEIPSYPGEGKGGGEGSTGKDGTIFFLMVRARRAAGRQRVIFWFNGGPGCSSFDGALMEVGPFRTVPASLTDSGKTELKLVEGGWEEYATIVYVDQPPGTGYSFVPTDGYLHELNEASQHLIQFLSNFYKVFPELAGVDTYLAGESYAGQYIPYFADALLKTKRLPGFDLQGLVIGNGWIDPLRQYPAYAEFAYEKGLIKKGSADGKSLDQALEQCNEAMERHKDPLKTPINIGECARVMDHVTDPFIAEINGKKTCKNIYDIRLTDEYPACGMGWPPDLSDVYEFLKRPDVKKAFHADLHAPAWVECDSSVSAHLRNYNSPASVHLLPGIVEAGVPILMFAGAEDLICNYVGIERMIESLEWNGQKGFGNATTEEWHLNKTQVGEWTTARNLSYAKLFDASHMAGFDVPHVTNDMIMRFMGVDMDLLPGLTGTLLSSVGDDERLPVHFGEIEKPSTGIPILKGGKSDWEAWYNAISAVLILFTLAGIVGAYLFFRRRRLRRMGPVALGEEGLGSGGSRSGRRRRRPTARRDSEERVPLAAAAEEYELDTHPDSGRGTPSAANGGAEYGGGKGKGKAKARESEDYERSETVFALGDDEV